ncbi:hypothetical protein SAMN04487948_102509 [Halogranum amylolyticum]|uniref:PGF-CTERM protein n=1 Tax=Halogranum amylolyticum TaxID=660520 RepID=A0A1H8PVJ9_9EURY|nr:hypothetical protein [Halogranum amylolyticum]SEO45816.1 hypothetical protein SAMN04487948_102509 [Halogranum amylolyticum]
MRILAVVATVLLVTSATAGVASVAGAQNASAYDGAHVTFGTQSNALTDYRVDGTTFFDSVSVQSKQTAEDDGPLGVGSDVGSVASLSGSGLTVDSRTTTNATITADSGATIDVHDNPHGIMVVESTNATQYVQLNVSEKGEAGYWGDATAVIETDEGPEAAAFVVGNGTVGVNDDGDVVAEVGEDGYLVVRTYDRRRGTDDRNQESLIADGVATAEAYVMQQDGERVVDTVTYGETTSLRTSEQSADRVELAVDRTTQEGTVLLASVSNEALDGASGLSVTVDGETAARATAYSELPMAADGGQRSKYLTQPSSSVDSTTEAAVAVNHFSERTVALQGGQANGSATDTSGETTTAGDSGPATESDAGTETETTTQTETSSPGFGLVAAVTALAALVVASVARSRQRD